MALTRTVYVARTAYDLEHVNRLHVPRFGSKSVPDDRHQEQQVVLSFTRRRNRSRKPRRRTISTSRPRRKSRKSSTSWTYIGGCINKATLELFHRNNKDAIWKKELKDDDILHGEHEIEWDGKIDKDTDFPEEYITVEHSPYKLKLTLEGDAEARLSPAAWTYLHVLVHSFEFEKGEKEVVSRLKDLRLKISSTS